MVSVFYHRKLNSLREKALFGIIDGASYREKNYFTSMIVIVHLATLNTFLGRQLGGMQRSSGFTLSFSQCDLTFHLILTGDASHPLEETHFSCLYPRSRSFSPGPSFMTIGEGTNEHRPVDG